MQQLRRVTIIALVITGLLIGPGSVLVRPRPAQAASCEIDFSFKLTKLLGGEKTFLEGKKIDPCAVLIDELKIFLNETIKPKFHDTRKDVLNGVSNKFDASKTDFKETIEPKFKTVLTDVLQEISSTADDFMKEVPVKDVLEPVAGVIVSKLDDPSTILANLQECPDPNDTTTLNLMADTVDTGIEIVELAFKSKGFNKLIRSDINVTSDDTLANYWEARRKLDWLTEQVHDNMPDDVTTVAGKVLIGGFYLTSNRLTTCLKYYDDIATWNKVFANFDTIQTDQTTHDSDIKAGQTALATQVLMHDSDVKAGQTALTTQVQTHDSDIKAGQDALSTQIAELDNGTETDVEMLSAQLQAAQDQMVRIQIVQVLSDKTDIKRLSLFYLPAAYGGQLELVRQTVLDAIEIKEAAGSNVNQAKKEFNQAEGAFAAGDYKKAYDNYAQAYKKLNLGTNKPDSAVVAGNNNAPGQSNANHGNNNVGPVVEAGADQTIKRGDSVLLELATFTIPGILDPHTVTINRGDGTVEESLVTEPSSKGGGGSVTGSPADADNASYTVTVCVTDNDGGEGDCDNLTITAIRSDSTGVTDSVIYLPLIVKN